MKNNRMTNNKYDCKNRNFCRQQSYRRIGMSILTALVDEIEFPNIKEELNV